MNYLLGSSRVRVPAFEGPEFQPNVIFMEVGGERGSGIDFVKKQDRSSFRS
jgi:hypothetical protein